MRMFNKKEILVKPPEGVTFDNPAKYYVIEVIDNNQIMSIGINTQYKDSNNQHLLELNEKLDSPISVEEFDLLKTLEWQKVEVDPVVPESRES
jgi:hypothetical protein